MEAFFNSIGYASWGLHFLLWFPLVLMLSSRLRPPAAIWWGMASRPRWGRQRPPAIFDPRAYHAAGQFEKAISVYQRNQFRYPNSLAASKSGVPLAQAYIAKGGPDADRKAGLFRVPRVLGS